jgi:hypothetical protein
MVLGILVCTVPAHEALRADEASESIKSDRGGWMATTKHHRFEVFFYKTGIRVFPHDESKTPVPVATLSGNVSFSLPGDQKPLVYTLKGKSVPKGREQRSLDLSADLSWVPAGKVKVDFTISGLDDPREEEATFSVPFVLVAPIPPASTQGQYTFVAADPSDRRAIEAQEFCPVCGKMLDPDGPVIKVTKGNRVLLLDTENCVELFHKTPDRYFDAASRPVAAATTPSAPRYTYQRGYYGAGYYPAAATSAPRLVPAVSPVYAAPREVPIERQAASPHWSFDYDEWMDHNL